MWRYDATPTPIPAFTGATSVPHTGRAVKGHDPPHMVSSAQPGRIEVEVAAEELAPARARSAVERWLSGRVSERLVDDVRLLVSELVANSVRHARLAGDATIRVSVAIVGGMVRVEVEDPGDGAIAAVPPDREHGGGFGLYLVEILAERWGSSHDGKTCVWAELAVSPAT